MNPPQVGNMWRMVISDRHGLKGAKLYGRDDLTFGTLRRNIYGRTDKGMVYLVPEAIEIFRSLDGESELLVCGAPIMGAP